MPIGLAPSVVPEGTAPSTDPQTVVEDFLAALAASDVERAAALVDDDIVYVNVGLPAVRGREEFAKVLRLLDRPGAGFEVYIHSIAADGSSVLTERTDVLVVGRIRAQFWVWGRFDVRDGRITLWRDSFDAVDVWRGTVRGLVGALVPRCRPRAPIGPGSVPGR